MKKIFKTLAVCAVAGTLCAGVAAIAGCDSSVKGEAYALVHNAGYVGYATVTVKGDKISDVTLNEVCFPTQVNLTGTSTTSAEDAKSKITNLNETDYVVVETSSTKDEVTTYTATAYYKTVSYGEVTMTYDATANDGKGSYLVGTQLLKNYLADSVKAEVYYKAVMNGEVTVTVGTEKKSGVMTKAALSKDENGYWTRTDKDGNSYSRWKMNRDATVNYVKEHGIDNLLKLVKATDGAADAKEDKDVMYWMDGTISTGATWNDLNPESTNGYVSYAKLIVTAYNAAKSAN